MVSHIRMVDFPHLCYWLVVYLPLWKIWKSVGVIILNIWKNKKCSKAPTRLCAFSKLLVPAPHPASPQKKPSTHPPLNRHLVPRWTKGLCCKVTNAVLLVFEEGRYSCASWGADITPVSRILRAGHMAVKMGTTWGYIYIITGHDTTGKMINLQNSSNSSLFFGYPILRQTQMI